MKITLRDNASLRTVRRLMRPSGVRLTVRYGSVYTVQAVRQRQPNSAAQRKARAVFAEANSLAVEELRSDERRTYWARRARETGYRTAIGACRAEYVRRLREERKNVVRPEVHARMADCVVRVVRSGKWKRSVRTAGVPHWRMNALGVRRLSLMERCAEATMEGST